MKKYQIKRSSADGVEYVDHFSYDFREIDDPESFDIYDLDSSVDLDNCPFCGVKGTMNADGRGWFGWCSICGAEGPRHYNWYMAARMWNNRNLETVVDAKKLSIDKLKSMDIERFSEESKSFLGCK